MENWKIPYLKSRIHRDILKIVKRIKYSVCSHVRCHECHRTILFYESVNLEYCSVFCRMRHDDRIFRQLCGGC